MTTLASATSPSRDLTSFSQMETEGSIFHSNPFDMAFTTSPHRVGPLDIPSADQISASTKTTPSRPTVAIPESHLLATSSPSRLTFAKVRVSKQQQQTSSACTTSTDSEMIHSDGGVGPDDHPSPSLLSYIFARQNSLGGSSSAQSGDTPVTPSLPILTPCGRPILRRPESQNISEDGMSKSSHLPQGLSKFTPYIGMNGLGLSTEREETEDSANEIKDHDRELSSQMGKRRSCLTFAVKSPPSRPMSTISVPITSPRSPSPSGSPKPRSRGSPSSKDKAHSVSLWANGQHSFMSRERMDEEDEDEEEEENDEDADDDAGLDYDYEQDQSESEDDGYQEDEEGGFTSDEEFEISAFTTRSSTNPPTSSGSSFISSRPHTPHTPATGFGQYSPPQNYTYPSFASRDIAAPVSTSTSDDGHDHHNERPSRGRKISIAISNCAEKCSRHRSPPPSSSRRSARGGGGGGSRPGSPECPPAARSPSAMGLCRRRESAAGVARMESTKAKGQVTLKGWKSDTPGPTATLRTRSMGPPATTAMPSAPCKSILRSSSTVMGPPLAETSPQGGRRASMSAVGALDAAV